jgi:hypothetical protein
MDEATYKNHPFAPETLARLREEAKAFRSYIIYQRYLDALDEIRRLQRLEAEWKKREAIDLVAQILRDWPCGQAAKKADISAIDRILAEYVTNHDGCVEDDPKSLAEYALREFGLPPEVADSI